MRKRFRYCAREKKLKKFKKGIDTTRVYCYNIDNKEKERKEKMKNEVMRHKMVEFYKETAYTHNYIFGYAYKKNVYMTITTSEVLNEIISLDKAGHNEGVAIKFKPNNAQKLMLMSINNEPICTEEYLESLFKESKYNRGEIFEKIITEKYGQTWVKDNIPYTVDGDITIDGIAYQIKYQKATFLTEKGMIKKMGR